VAHLNRLPQLDHTTGSGTNDDDGAALDVDRTLVVVAVVVVLETDDATSPTSVVHAVTSTVAEANSATRARRGTGGW
jgi:hypothetical protein